MKFIVLLDINKNEEEVNREETNEKILPLSDCAVKPSPSGRGYKARVAKQSLKFQ